MEIRKPKIKSLPYNEFKDNDTLQKLTDELNQGGTNVVLGNLDWVVNWGRSNSLWSLTFATSCCGIEFMAIGCARYDFSRFGFEVTRNSPRQADIIMCAGTITNKMAPVLKRLYDEMAEPKYVVAVGGCTISGGPFKSSYHIVRGIDELVPVDVYVPGCPPRPEAIIYGMMQLQRKVKIERFFGGANHKMTPEEREESMKLGGLHGLSNENLTFARELHKDEPIIVKDGVTNEQVERLGEELDILSAQEGKQKEAQEVKAQTSAQPASAAAPASTETNKNQENTPTA
ncbi:NADH-quinone oxidoreductase subunit B [Prevotella cerevisiae]|uniref:NADH-quinone oxidoreductase subunit B n=1 Tax=Segatella cerevisiae TaxID=2053716 RepID=A0ABT1BZ30_9BACT|nr:NADH-quinone oxidoreductase subunit B [Segatella cerevisiae]MCO6026337.1 NADH-quinone oxidoreductase subunit B [Segatella cerevisiae]